MIKLNRLNGVEFVVNCELIKFIESTPDTVITLTSGEKLMVKQSVNDVIAATVLYRKKLFQEPFSNQEAPQGATQGVQKR